MKRIGLLSLALATTLTVACNGNNARNDTANDANTVGTAGVAERNNGSSADRNFVQDMLADGDAEVQLAKMAEQHAASPEVKRFAAMMVADHTKAGAELKKIAAEYNIQPDPARKDDKHHDLMDKLSKLSGREFDREYMSAMVDDHKDAVDHLESRVDVKRTDNGTVTDKVKGTFGADKATAERSGNIKPEKADDHVEYSVNQWAAMTLPTVRHHLDEARQINDRVQNNRTAAAAHPIAHAKAAHKAKS